MSYEYIPADETELNLADGEQFLAELDAALEGQTLTCPRAEIANFGAQVGKSLAPAATPALDAEIEARIKAELMRTLPSTATARFRTVKTTQSTKKTGRSAFGVLDVVALITLTILLVSLYRAWQEPNLKKEHSPHRSIAGDPEPDHKVKPSPRPSPVPAPGPNPDQKLEDKLQQRITYDFSGKNVDEAVAALRKLSSLTIIVDPAKQIGDKKCNLNAHDMRLEHALAWISRFAGTDFRVKDSAVFISDERTLFPVQLSIYDVSDAGISSEVLGRLLKERLFAAEFSDPKTSIDYAHAGQLVINQTEPMQARIGAVLKKLIAKESVALIEPEQPSQWRTEIEEKLNQNVTFELNNVPLSDALRTIQKQLDPITFFINPPADTPITLRVTRMKAGLALGWLLRLADLEYYLKDGAVVIDNKAPFPSGYELRIYDVKDVNKPEFPRTAADIADELQKNIDPDSWAAVLGTGMDVKDDRLLIVVNKPVIQKQIQEYLKALRNTVLGSNHDAQPAVSPPESEPNIKIKGDE
jgi:hypothetical protein